MSVCSYKVKSLEGGKRWYYDFYVGIIEGKRKVIKRSGFESFEEAEKQMKIAKENYYRTEIVKNELMDNFKPTNELNSYMKGKIGEKIVEVDLIRLGIEPYTPSLDGSACDLVGFYGNKYYKIQVKCANSIGETKLNVDARRSSGTKSRKYEEDAYDILAIVDLVSLKIAYLSKKELNGQHSFMFWRGNPPKGTNGLGKDKAPRLFNDYLNFSRAVSFV